MTAVALTAVLGWALAGGALGGVVLLRRRLALVARAEHELRGPVTVLSLTSERLRRDRASEHHAFPLESELARLCQGLDDLAAARHGARARPGRAATPAPLEAMARSAVAGWAPLFRRLGRSPRMSWDAGPSPVDMPRGQGGPGARQPAGQRGRARVGRGRGARGAEPARSPGGGAQRREAARRCDRPRSRTRTANRARGGRGGGRIAGDEGGRRSDGGRDRAASGRRRPVGGERPARRRPPAGGVNVRRRRALVLLALALACGGLAASQVRQKVREVEARTGAPVPVVVARESIPADRQIDPGSLTVRQVPERYAPPDGLAAPEDAAGLRTAGAVRAGTYLTAAHLQGAGGKGDASLRRGERALEVSVAGGEALAGAAPGSTVDVLVSTEGREGAGRSFLALESVELLDLQAGAGGGGPESEDGEGPVSREGAAARGHGDGDTARHHAPGRLPDGGPELRQRGAPAAAPARRPLARGPCGGGRWRALRASTCRTTSAAGSSGASSWACPAQRLISSASPRSRAAARTGAVRWWSSGYAAGASSCSARKRFTIPRAGLPVNARVSRVSPGRASASRWRRRGARFRAAHERGAHLGRPGARRQHGRHGGRGGDPAGGHQRPRAVGAAEQGEQRQQAVLARRCRPRRRRGGRRPPRPGRSGRPRRPRARATPRPGW